jgi:hypothetical protein
MKQIDVCGNIQRLVCAFTVLILSGCPFMGPVYEEDLVGDYAISATDTMKDAAIIRKGRDPSNAEIVVPRMVFAYGWNDEYIIARQHPENDYKVDKGTTHWYVVEVLTGKVHGPMDEDAFRTLHTELGIPAQISLKTIHGSPQ